MILAYWEMSAEQSLKVFACCNVGTLQVLVGMLLAIMGMIWYGNASSRPGGKERVVMPPVQEAEKVPMLDRGAERRGGAEEP